MLVRNFIRKRAIIVFLAIILASPFFTQRSLAIPVGAPTVPGNAGFAYGEALQKSILFYEAQRAGPYRGRIPWRGNAAMNDGSDAGVDLVGGWFDAGDHMKFGFPMASSVTMLSWGGVEFRGAYQNAGQLDELLDNVKWATDYLLKAYRPGGAGAADDVFYGQVGIGSLDHGWWGPSEVMPMARPSFKLTSTCRGSDLAGESAAAMAAASVLFRPTDAAYANQLLNAAEGLYTFADTYRGMYHLCITDVTEYYKSWSGYEDELVWGALWLYRAKEAAGAGSGGSYMTKAQNSYNNLDRSASWTQDWDGKSKGAMLLMSRFATNSSIKSQATGETEAWLNYWAWPYIPGYSGAKGAYSPGGRMHVGQWGSLRYASNTALLAFIYADYTTNGTKRTQYQNFASSQINYILGANPRNGSFMVGFGQNYPQHPHHDTAHGTWLNDINTPPNHRHILYGALVGGPGDVNSDTLNDSINDYVENEVADDYNAGLPGSLAKMHALYGGNLLPDSAFPLPDKPYTCIDEFPLEIKVNGTTSTSTEFSAFVNNRSGWPARKLTNMKFRYYFTLDGGSIGNISATLTSANGATISSPIAWDAGNGVYYVTIDLAGQALAPDGATYRREVRFRLSTSSGSWNNGNDHSFNGWVDYAYPQTGYKHAPNAPVYAGNTRLCGSEPGGVSPTTPAPITATNTRTPTYTPTTPAPITATNTATIVTPQSNGTPYNGTPVSLPGRIEVENYNLGGQNVAYNDTTAGNAGGAYRTGDRVDIEPCTDSGCGHNVGWTVTGEWLKYTVNVTSAGTYLIEFRVATQSNGAKFHLEVDNVNVTGNIDVPNTGGWQTWRTVSKSVNLPAGQHVFRLVFDGSDGNFNWINVVPGELPAPTATPTATRTPTRTPTQPTFQPPTNTGTPTQGSGAPAWNGNSQAYTVGDLVTYNGVVYRCIQAHTSLPSWTPDAVASLWTPV
jgi:endoglucanase